MDKLYIPIVHKQPARVIPLNASPLDEWISVEEAAKLFRSLKRPNGILPQSLKNKIWRNELPRHSYLWAPVGLLFHKPTLMGLRSIHSLTAA